VRGVEFSSPKFIMRSMKPPDTKSTQSVVFYHIHIAELYSENSSHNLKHLPTKFKCGRFEKHAMIILELSTHTVLGNNLNN
jgi:hypothetical protein